MALLDILKQYTGSATPPAGDVLNHFEEVARDAPRADLGNGIAAALRADATPSFGDTVGSLYGQSSPQQQAGVLNQIVQSLPPGALAGLATGVLGKLFGGMPQDEAQRPYISSDQASQLTPTEVTTIANHAERHSGSVVDSVAGFYAQHPDVVKSMGAAALAIALGHMSTHR